MITKNDADIASKVISEIIRLRKLTPGNPAQVVTSYWYTICNSMIIAITEETNKATPAPVLTAQQLQDNYDHAMKGLV